MVQEMKNYTVQLNDENVRPVIELVIDGEVVGRVVLSSLGTGAYYIEEAEIDKEYRGKGFYTVMLIACFQIAGAEMLVSNNRNADSNGAYEHWTGQELSYDQEVTIGLYGDSLGFDVSE